MNDLCMEYPLCASRRSDPSTSRDAAARANGWASSHAGRIHLALIEAGTATAHDLSLATGLSVVQIDRRASEMKRMGLIDYVRHPDGSLVVRNGFRVWRRS